MPGIKEGVLSLTLLVLLFMAATTAESDDNLTELPFHDFPQIATAMIIGTISFTENVLPRGVPPTEAVSNVTSRLLHTPMILTRRIPL